MSKPVVHHFDLLRELARGTSRSPSPAMARLRSQALKLLEDEGLATASCCYQIIPLSRAADETLHVGGERLHAPGLLPESGQLTALGFGVCTLGPQLDQRVNSLFAEKRASLALAVDELGSEMLFAAGRRLRRRVQVVCRRRGLSVGTQLHPGDPGLDIAAQAEVLQLADAGQIGMELHRGQLLKPFKSSSVVFAIGIDLPAVAWSGCDHCPAAAKCRFRTPPSNLQPNVLAVAV